MRAPAGAVAFVLAAAAALVPAPAADAKSAQFEIAARCPCAGPATGGFWTSRTERLGCVDAVLEDLRADGWPEVILTNDRRREGRSRCGEPRFQCDGTGARPCPRGTVCESIDATCAPGGTPSVCLPPRLLRRLHGCRKEPEACGCDGRTYANPCALWRAGATWAHAYTCARGCGGPEGRTCGADEYCAVLACGEGGEWGVCQSRQTTCRGTLVPVCGCDGRDHASACAAHAAGVEVRYYSACPTD